MTSTDLLQQAIALHQSGKLYDDLRLYDQVISVDPDNADALHLSGLVHHQLWQNERAASLIGQAVSRRPDSALYLNNYLIVLNELRLFSDAVTVAQKVTELDPGNGAGWYGLGVSLAGLGNYPEAQKAISQAVSIEPQNPLYLNLLGNCYRGLNQDELAISSFRKAVAAQSDYFLAALNLADTLLATGDLDEAQSICDAVLVQVPDHELPYLIKGGIALRRSDHRDAEELFRMSVDLAPEDTRGYLGLAGVPNITGKFADALDILQKAEMIDLEKAAVKQQQGSLLLLLGHHDEAAAKLREAIALDPDIASAYFELVQLKNNSLSQEEFAHVRRMTNRDELPEVSRSVAAFACAHIEEKSGSYDEAFVHLKLANELRLKVLNRAGHSFDPSSHEKFIDRIMSVFENITLPCGNNSDVPLFVLGLPRSGTTLVERIINSHSAAFGAGELTEFKKLSDQILIEKGRYPDGLSQFAEGDAGNLAYQYLKHLTFQAPDARRIVDKNPFNFLHLGLIHAVFPNAKIIHCRRNLMDVGLSIYMQNFADPLPWTNELEAIGEYIKLYERLMAFWRDSLNIKILEVHYEELVTDLETYSRQIIDHVELEWESGCLDFYKIEGGVQTASTAQVREPVYTRSIGKWRNYETQLLPLANILQT